MWLVHMAMNFMYFVQFIIGDKENLIKATDNKKRVKEIIEKNYKNGIKVV